MTWVIHTDGGSRGNPGPGALGYAIMRDGAEIVAVGEFLGTCTNNTAEYTAVLRALQHFARLAAPGAAVEVRADSKLVVEQMSGRWKIKHPDMRSLAFKVRRAYPPELVRYTWVPRADNARADEMANRAMDARGPVEVLAPTLEGSQAAPAAGPARIVVVDAQVSDGTLAVLDRLNVGVDPRFSGVCLVHGPDAPAQRAAVRIARHVRAAGAVDLEVTERSVGRGELSNLDGLSGVCILVTSHCADVLAPLLARRACLALTPGSVSALDISDGAITIRTLGALA
ncbi:MAG: reverse transcriptase-like protein [Bowdeniella nasicola]|nr:reverse transcriptase-like protein [Bowdeniella nasicola]